ncbi:MAG: PH domain-containing protein [Bacteroidetes bacterium]|nr:PH domain-containing protein [Bacteroidota bacterium]
MENSEGQLIHKGEFNSVLKIYILLYVGFILIVSIIGIPLAIAWFCGIGQWYSRHYFDKLECTLTNKNLKFKKGIIVQFEKTIPLENIQDMSFIEGPLLRHFNLCVLKIETAGGSANTANQMSLVGIKDAPTFRLKVLEQRTLLKNNQSNQTDNNVLVEIKESLLRIEGILKENKK